jgi:hypothetical protein
MSVSEDRPKVVYVMGAGHSGSTILGITLGNCEGIFFAGELARWFRWEGKPPRRGAERAQFWDGVREQVEIDLSGPEARSVERSSAAFRLAGRIAQRRRRARYARGAEELFRATARATGATHIVDTSHFPRRARILQGLGGIDLYLLFLVRDPQSVLASYKSKEIATWPKRVTVMTNTYLWLTHLLALFVFLRHPRERRLFLRHEAFVANPEGVLRDIFETIDSSASTPDLSALETGVPFQGNRLIRSDVVALRRHPPEPPRGSRVTALVQSPWRVAFALLRPTATTSAPTAATLDRVSDVSV